MMNVMNELFLTKLGFDYSDFKLIKMDMMNELYKVILNDIDCGLVYISMVEDNDLYERVPLLREIILKDETLDFFILTNGLKLIFVLTDHNGSLLPQTIDINNNPNILEMTCSKHFIKKLISNRGVNYYHD